MGLKIFLLIASFCLVQVKSQCSSLPVRVLVKDVLDIQKKMDGLAEAVTLSDTKCLWKIKNSGRKSFSRCYKVSRKDDHRQAVVTFFYHTINAGETLEKSLPSYYNERVKNVRIHMNNLTNVAKDCQSEFSAKVSKDEYFGVEKLVNDCEVNIEAEFMKLYAELQGIHDSTNLGSDLQALGACEKELEKQMDDMKEESKTIIKKIKECMKIS